MKIGRKLLTISTCAIGITLAGCATHHSGQGTFATSEQGAASSADLTDASFARQACQAAAGEVEIARLAALNTKTAEIRRFAQRLEKDHLKADKALARIFSSRNMSPETEYEQYVQSSYHRLTDLKGGAFDAAFKEEVIRSHERAISLYEQQLDEGEDQTLNAFARQHLPKLRSHLQAARGLPVSSDLEGPEVEVNEAGAVINHPVTRSVQIGR